jgi:hypothetical protein
MAHHTDNLSAGTQVVSLVEVRGTNNSLVHPRGAVGVVARTPAVAGEKFLVRFPDGFEFSLHRGQMEVLKHFAVKRGEVPWPEVDAWRKELHCDFEGALAETKLPERPDYEAANRFLIRARRDMAKGVSLCC